MDNTASGKFIGSMVFIATVVTLFCIQWDIVEYVVTLPWIPQTLIAMIHIIMNVFLSFIMKYISQIVLYKIAKWEEEQVK